MKTYVFVALLLMFSANYLWAQASAEMAYYHNYRNNTEAENEEILVKSFISAFPEQIHFRFNIIATSQVNLTLFDITGKKIAVLIDGVLERDTYKLSWKSDQYPSGLYVYVFSAGKFRKTGKLLLLNNRI